MSIRAQRGFTLIELLLAISILGLMSLGAYQFLANTSQSALRLNERQKNCWQLSVCRPSLQLT